MCIIIDIIIQDNDVHIATYVLIYYVICIITCVFFLHIL